MRYVTFAALAGAAALACGPLAAQAPEPQPGPPPASANEAAPPEATARFNFNRVDGGFLRLDNVSGQVALCAQRSVGWTCEAVPEERAAFDKEVARLQAEVDGLKTEIAALRAPTEPPRPPADLAPRADSGKTSGLKLPSKDDVQGARAAIDQACEKAWRQFVDMVADLQKDLGRKG